jgi:hypothetical protein
MVNATNSPAQKDISSINSPVSPMVVSDEDSDVEEVNMNHAELQDEEVSVAYQ